MLGLTRRWVAREFVIISVALSLAVGAMATTAAVTRAAPPDADATITQIQCDLVFPANYASYSFFASASYKGRWVDFSYTVRAEPGGTETDSGTVQMHDSRGLPILLSGSVAFGSATVPVDIVVTLDVEDNKGTVESFSERRSCGSA